MRALRVIFEGMVQGVGFRYTVTRFARDLGLNGRVKNLPDGSVELIVAGRQEDINRLCLSIENYFATHITQAKKKDVELSEEFTDFQIAS